MSERFCSNILVEYSELYEYGNVLSSNGRRWIPSWPKRDAKPHAEKPSTVETKPMVVRVDEQTVPRTSDISHRLT